MPETPDPDKASICLCMMVKNEALVIERAIASVKGLISYWVICDTGSTDGTQAVIREALKDVPGELHETEWKNFGANRTEVVALARGKSDYILFLDADMVAVVEGEFRDQLTQDQYEIRYTGPVDYSQPLLFANLHEWRYVGVTHEFLHAPTSGTSGFLPQLCIAHYGDGGSRAHKFERDIVLLLQGLESEPDNLRYRFYLAQSYKDLGRCEEALHWYEKRMEGEGWVEEKWYATYQRAEMKKALSHPWPEVMQAYMTAWDARPHRLEPLFAIVQHYREAGEYVQGYHLSSFALQGIHYPTQDMLFIERPVYDYLLLLEHAACALACGRVSETIQAVNQMMGAGRLPAWVYEHGIQARTMASDLLYGEGDPANDALPPVKVIVPFHNPGEYLTSCVESLLAQDAGNFEVLFVDDASTDAAKDFVPPAGLRAKLVRNSTRMGAAYNYHHAILEHCNPTDVVVCLDGDDALSCDDALSHIQALYARYGCWVMYGQYQETDGTPGISAPFASPRDFLTLRSQWRTSHIRTFRAGLYHRIADQDPEYTCMKDSKGDWLQSAVDAAIIFPLIEMAGFERTHFSEKVLYTYNTVNPGSHHYLDPGRQAEQFDEVRLKRPFARVEKYLPEHERE